MGLKDSQHVGKIIVHPENSNVIMVASQGPLWNKGGDRGFYRSEDGGKTWTKTLGDDEWTGVADAVIDPRNPNVVLCSHLAKTSNSSCLFWRWGKRRSPISPLMVVKLGQN